MMHCKDLSKSFQKIFRAFQLSLLTTSSIQANCVLLHLLLPKVKSTENIIYITD